MKKNWEFIAIAVLFTGFYGIRLLDTYEKAEEKTEIVYSLPAIAVQDFTYSQVETMADPVTGTDPVTKLNPVTMADPVIKRYSKKPDPLAADGNKFLFIGNSHTYVNDLPGTFLELALAGGHEVEVYEIVGPSYYLEEFSDPGDEYGSVVFDALGNEVWDFVILQENTNAAVSSNVETKMYEYARKLDKMAGDASAQTAFLMTWAPEDGAVFYTREKMQEVLSKNYTAIAKELDALLIPGGDIFTYALSREPDLKLWGEDGQHPSTEGTYLAACAAYTLFFQETPEGNSFMYDLEEAAAGKLQKIAYDYMMKEK